MSERCDPGQLTRDGQDYLNCVAPTNYSLIMFQSCLLVEDDGRPLTAEVSQFMLKMENVNVPN